MSANSWGGGRPLRKFFYVLPAHLYNCLMVQVILLLCRERGANGGKNDRFYNYIVYRSLNINIVYRSMVVLLIPDSLAK